MIQLNQPVTHLNNYTDRVTEMIMLHDFEGRIVDVNQAACSNLGYSREEMLSMTVFDIEKDFNLTSAQLAWSKVLANQLDILSGHVQRKDQSVFPVEVIFSKILIGSQPYFLGIAKDISERTNALALLHKSEEQYKYLLTNLKIGVIKQMPDGQIVFANEAALEKLGLTEDQLLGRTSVDPDWNVMHEDGSPFPGATHPAMVAIATRQPVKKVIMGVYRPALQDRVWLIVDAIPELDDKGNVQCVICTFNNITEVIETRQALMQSQQQMQQLNQSLQALHLSEAAANEQLALKNKELEQFAAAAAHDLQEPLRTITGFIKLLEKHHLDNFDAEAKKYFDFVQDGADRMKNLINDILTYARQGHEMQPTTSISISALVAELVPLRFAEQLRHDHQVNWPDNLPTIHADKTAMEQLFSNLIGNGLKYLEPDTKGMVTISAMQAPGYWQFAIADNGIGIHPENHQNIFTIFKRLHTSREYTGSGVGLATCKKIVELNNGKIWVTSTPGEGSTFYFTLPVS